MENQDFDFIFQSHKSLNTNIKLTEFDKKNGTKIYCKEPYAQELYDLFTNNSESSSSKDLIIGNTYSVVANTISYDDNEIHAEEVNSKNTIIIPFKEFDTQLSTLIEEEEFRSFNVKIYKLDKSGVYLGSKKKASAETYISELFSNYDSNRWFDVKIDRLVKGGYIALYKNQIECFIPGSLAAANIIKDFNILLNKEITVMVDSFDRSNNLFIVSHKKYIKHSLPVKINDLVFGKKYTGKLTSNPLKFGIFVEFENYYTALIHMSEFKDYSATRYEYKNGDLIDFYVKDVIYKKGQYRILLTLNESNINTEKIEWQNIKESLENKKVEYNFNKNSKTISIAIKGNNFNFSIKKRDFKKNFSNYPMIKIIKVDTINKRCNYEFIKSS